MLKLPLTYLWIYVTALAGVTLAAVVRHATVPGARGEVVWADARQPRRSRSENKG